MPKKRKARFNSLSTPNKKVDCSNYLVELVFLRQNRGRRLQPEFWKQQRYKYRFRKEIQACRKFIKKYGEAAVLKITLENTDIVSWADYGKIEFYLQKLLERRQLRALPKDESDVETESVEVEQDLREHIPSRRKSLFERLKELNNGEKETI